MNSQNQPPVYNGNSLEYLEQISSKKTNPGGFLNKKVIIIIAVVVFLLLLTILLSVFSKPSDTTAEQNLGYRLLGLSELITYSKENTINDSKLRKTLAETEIISLSEQYQISTYVTLPKIDSKKTPVPANESVSQTVDDLKTAVSSGNFNRSLSDALVLQIERIEESLQEIRSKSRSQLQTTKINESLIEYDAITERLVNY